MSGIATTLSLTFLVSPNFHLLNSPMEVTVRLRERALDIILFPLGISVFQDHCRVLG